ncbi:cupredoxin domain-containing protein [Corynebacterium sp.]|uniref:cupredoxin domain-containing protein n=1 Tax=Corynebacterium sp. TaxID=1720 RepID=UPI002A90D667|nr:cupredoxin domain-containing protein [Corynebacterium sp.]MDY5785401.1 cupredoxin domain-containing protein [Corynebacterium sp.]
MQRTDSIAWGIVAVFLTAVVAVTLAFGSSDARSNAALPTGDDIVTAEVTIEGMHFVPNSVEVPAGKRLVLKVTNPDTQQHDLKIGSGYTGRINPGESVVYDFGEFTEDAQGWCTIAGHKAMGMVFTVKATG